MKLLPRLLTATLLGFVPLCLSGNTLSSERAVERRMEFDVEHSPLASLWVEIYDAKDQLVAAWYLPWDEEWELVNGLPPVWIEQMLLDGWSGFAVDLPQPGRYRVVVTSLEDVWTLQLYAVVP